MKHLTVHVIAGSREERIEKLSETVWKIKIRQKPIEGKANEELCKKIAKEFGVAKSKVWVEKGKTAKTKLVCIDD